MSYGVSAYIVDLDTLPAQDLRHLDGWGLHSLMEATRALLPNHVWTGMRSSWFDAVDEALEAAGCAVQLRTYFYADPRRELGMSHMYDEDFPTIGHVRRDKVVWLRDQLDVTLADAEAQEAVDQFRGWLNDAAEAKIDLITFYG